ncbi:MAG: ACP S-malonyltransferase [Candidatus Brocadiia bacterium]
MDSIALLFPGQGAQTVGMGRDIAEMSPPARQTFDAANETLDMELDRLCFEGPQVELSRSDVAQPAILTVSVATLRALEDAAGGLPPVAGTAGLSLGEYSALVAAGALEFRDAVGLVRKRGLYMQEACDANPGTMYSVLGLEDEEVEDACTEARGRSNGLVWPANYNCPGQVVISGQEKAAAYAAEICDEMGARRVIQLDVAGAFHTRLMEPARDKLAIELENVEISEPRYPVVSNVTGEPNRDPDRIRELLALQVTSSVRWADGMRWLAGQGITDYLEVGPGKVLRGLLRRIDRSLNCQSVNTAEDVTETADTL